ncbi:alpha/beta hydrolase [Cerasicoccus arenae]|nr:alpha/beta hydrolase [Cerasicoccus arenae]
MLTPEAIRAVDSLDECPGVMTTRRHVIREHDGWEQIVYIYEPEQPCKGPRPTLVLVHGGGFCIGDPISQTPIARYLALHFGITTISPSYRLGAPETPTYPAPLEDIAFAWEWARNHAAEWNLDAGKMFVGGSSAGGTLSALSLTKGMLPNCRGLVEYWGPLDFICRWFDNGEKSGGELNLLGCNYPENPTLFHEASALAHVKPGLPPAVFIYGIQDTTVHKRQGLLGVAAWKSVSAHAEYYEFDNIGHGIIGDNTESMVQVMLRTGVFLQSLL